MILRVMIALGLSFDYLSVSLNCAGGTRVLHGSNYVAWCPSLGNLLVHWLCLMCFHEHHPAPRRLYGLQEDELPQGRMDPREYAK